MTDINIFEFAAREKLRFPSDVGSLMVEQLWDLPLTSAGNKANLNTIGLQFVNLLKASNEESLVKPAPTGWDKVYQIQLDIVKHIIAVKQAEAEEKKLAVAKAAQKKKLTEALAARQDANLQNMSEEEILKAIEAL